MLIMNKIKILIMNDDLYIWIDKEILIIENIKYENKEYSDWIRCCSCWIFCNF